MAKHTKKAESAASTETASDANVRVESDATATAPTKRGRKPKAIASDAVVDTNATNESVPAALAAEVPAIAATPTPEKGRKRAIEDASLADAFAGYLRGLEEAEKSEGTIFSYRLELTLAGAELGIDTKLVDLMPERVLLFFTSDRVMRTRSGRAKSPLSIDKTRRVVRQALVWAEAAGMVAKAPIPELAATY